MRHSFAVLLIATLLAVTGCAAWTPSPADDDLGEVADFALTERSGEKVHRADLLGKVWVAAFGFTRCTGPCPQVSGTMARLQAELAGQPDVRLVSFSVDPDHDTPEVLRDYAQRFGADPHRWLFLTGPRDDVYRLILESFHLAVQQNEGEARRPGQEVTHSTRLALVDRSGHIRGYFDGRQVDEEGQPIADLDRLKQRIAVLVKEKP
jgi:cytochrome oxidase Cu insertion factor (SCO1/SenC/PrrC family)